MQSHDLQQHELQARILLDLQKRLEAAQHGNWRYVALRVVIAFCRFQLSDIHSIEQQDSSAAIDGLSKRNTRHMMMT